MLYLQNLLHCVNRILQEYMMLKKIDSRAFHLDFNKFKFACVLVFLCFKSFQIIKHWQFVEVKENKYFFFNWLMERSKYMGHNIYHINMYFVTN